MIVPNLPRIAFRNSIRVTRRSVSTSIARRAVGYGSDESDQKPMSKSEATSTGRNDSKHSSAKSDQSGEKGGAKLPRNENPQQQQRARENKSGAQKQDADSNLLEDSGLQHGS